MHNRMRELALLSLAGALALGLVALVWAIGIGSSEAQDGTMHNCPAAGKWSISVWDGSSGTAAADALATCGPDAVDVAYSLDAQTGGWLRWFAGKPEASNLPPLDDKQGVLALGGTAAVGAAAAERVGAAQAAGQLRNCPPAGKWSIAVWDAQDGTAAADALATCGADAVDAAYSLDPQTGGWLRWFAGKPEASNLATMENLQGVLALGSATGEQGLGPLPAWWVPTWSEDGVDLSVEYTQGTGKLSESIHVGTSYDSFGVPVEGSEVTVRKGEDIYGRELDMTIGTLSGWHAQLKPDSVVASGTATHPAGFARTLRVTVHYEYNESQLRGGSGNEEFSVRIPGGITYSGSATGTFTAQYGQLVWTERVENTSYYLGDKPYAETVIVTTPESDYLGGRLVVVQQSVKTTTTYADGSRRESDIVISWQRDENGVCSGKSGSGVVTGTEVVNGTPVDYTGSVTLDYGFDSHIGWYKTGYSEARSAETELPKRLPFEVIFIDDPYLRPVF